MNLNPFARIRAWLNQPVLEKLHIIMSAVSQYAAKQSAFNKSQAAQIDAVLASVTGVVADVKSLNDKITAMQNSAGEISVEDQATLDALETEGNALVTRTEAAATAAKALDDQTPPAVPTA